VYRKQQQQLVDKVTTTTRDVENGSRVPGIGTTPTRTHQDDGAVSLLPLPPLRGEGFFCVLLLSTILLLLYFIIYILSTIVFYYIYIINPPSDYLVQEFVCQKPRLGPSRAKAKP
jgi:hypothetical protein